MFDQFFRRKKEEQKYYFVLGISDRPTDGFEIKPDKDCQMFLFTGETEPNNIIPKITLKAAMDKFHEKDNKIIINQDL